MGSVGPAGGTTTNGLILRLGPARRDHEDSEDVDAYLVVLRDDGTEVARDDDGGGDFNARVEFEAPATGRYTILAASLYSETTGRYTIRVERPAGGEETPTADGLSRRGSLRAMKGRGLDSIGILQTIFPLCAASIVTPAGSLTAQAVPDSGSVMATGQVFRDCPSCPEMVVVPSGIFIMGSPESEQGRLRAVYDQEGTAVRWTVIDELDLEVEEGQRLVTVEGPQRYVTIEVPFAVGVYELTFDEWDACARSGGCGGLIPDNEGWGRGTTTGDQRQLGRRERLRGLAVERDRRGIPALDRGGVGVRREGRHGDGAVLGRESLGAVPACQRRRCHGAGAKPGLEDGDVLRRLCGAGPSRVV